MRTLQQRLKCVSCCTSALNSGPIGMGVERATNGRSCIFPKTERTKFPAAFPVLKLHHQPLNTSHLKQGVCQSGMTPRPPPPRWFFGPAFAYSCAFLPPFSFLSPFLRVFIYRFPVTVSSILCSIASKRSGNYENCLMSPCSDLILFFCCFVLH